ncbi:Uncharacterised protein [Bordetella ansorpii]|uniref:Uncharacterized protein n=1 Tax=Bordetella ansorpii TaxID=288768 RepID=A0A157S4H3_9BORD|nr:hypothetical protein [Bordetella ansorpii]SAI65304.1 Uncharacterised protein [Bordetella ansorpii]
MPNPISALGLGHTLISLIPIAAGIYSFVRYRKIDSGTSAGRIYLGGLTLSVLTAFGLSSTGGFNAGHALGILALLVVGGGWLVPRIPLLRRFQAYLSPFALSFSFFLLLVPGIGETLRRLPAAHPLADSPQSPVVQGALLAWLVIFVLGAGVQAWGIRSQRKARSFG